MVGGSGKIAQDNQDPLWCCECCSYAHLADRFVGRSSRFPVTGEVLGKPIPRTNSLAVRPSFLLLEMLWLQYFC